MRSALALVAALLFPASGAAQVEAWRAQYDSPESKPATFFAFGGALIGDPPIAVAPDGSLTSILTVSDGQWRSFLTRHDAAGVLLWSHEYDGEPFTAALSGALESDEAGNTFVCGMTTTGEAAVTKIDPSGEVVWTASPDGEIGLELLAAGPEGSIYAAGNLFVNNIPRTFVVRFSSDGTEEWRYVRDWAPGTQSNVFDLAVDDEGDAVVAGAFSNPPADYLVVKIDSEGNEVWERRFDGGSHDVARSVAIDPSGRVTVVGVSATGVSGADVQGDYVTVQFDPDGTERWSTRLVRPGDLYPNVWIISRVAADSAGATYVVGEADAADRSPGLVVKYDSEGNESWRDTFGDIGKGLQVAVGGDGNVYVAGVETVDDVSRLIVLSYQPDGTRRWVHLGSPAVYTTPAALLLSDGHVLVGATAFTGEFEEGQVLWLALDTEGELLWQVGNPFLGLADGHCRGCLALGPDGAVHLAGFSIEKSSLTPLGRTVKLESGGALDWSRGLPLLFGVYPTSAKALAVDEAGNVVVAGSPWMIVKYDASGKQLWVSSIHQSIRLESAGAQFVGTGSTGASYVAGGAFLPAAGGPYPQGQKVTYLVKYQSDGTESWIRSFAGYVELLTQLVTTDERVVLAGHTYVDGGLQAMARSYDSTGGLLFDRVLTSAGADARLAALAAVGTDVIGVGRARSETDYDVLVVRLDSSGEVVWRRDLDGDAEGVEWDDEATTVAVDPTGPIYVAGRTWNGDDFDILVIKLDAAGNELWRRAIDLGHGDDEAWAAAFDARGAGKTAGSLWIAGRASNGSDTDALTLRFDADGNELFRAVVAGTEQRDDEHYDLVVGPPGHATVAGRTAEIDESYNFQAIRYVTSPLDVDYDGEAGALTDGLLMRRWLFGFRGSVLEVGAVDQALCVRCPAQQIDLHLSAIEKLLDVDGDGAAEPLTDGTLILRWLFGFHGDTLVTGAVDLADCSRCDAAAIEAYFETLAN